MKRLRLQINDPGHFSLKRAARAAIVMPGVFAFADQVIVDPDTTLFAAFGSIALLVLTDFGGPWRRRLAAYLTLAVAGAALITLGTLCSQTPWLAVAAMAVVGFAILFSGVISAYFAAAGFAALLLFIIPVTFPGSASSIPARLEGWGLAASVGICAVMLLWPSQPRDKLRAAAARASGALADLLDSESSGSRPAIAAGSDAASAAVSDLRRSFAATPNRPSGPTGSTEALVFLVDGFEWLLSIVSATARDIETRLDPCRNENREVMAASAAILRTSRANLDGEHEEPDLDRLERAQGAVVGSLVQRVGDLPAPQEEVALPTALEPSFRMRELSFAVREVGVNALLASGGMPPEAQAAPGARDGRASSPKGVAFRARSALTETGTLLLEHTTPRSPRFRNSLRGAAGLTVAVLVIQMASLQDSFWVALATLSVLRSSALGTGSTIVRALAGTGVGIVVGGLLVYAIGTNEGVPWAILPPAVLLAAYAPRAISFAAGQAGFTIVLLILFNLIQPTGWTVGLVRLEDVAIGCAISLAVGVLFWPRGAEKLLRESLGAAYARSADYVASAAQRLIGAAGTRSTENALASARATARGAAHRLDDAYRQYLTEPRAQSANLDSVATLVSGANRVRLGAYSLSTLTPAPADGPRLDTCADRLGADLEELRSWYFNLAHALVERTATSAEHPDDHPDGKPVVRCVSRAFAAGDESVVGPALGLLWSSQHLDNLGRLGVQLIQPTAELSRTSR
jgi:uncharacterized membrane protein YccC